MRFLLLFLLTFAVILPNQVSASYATITDSGEAVVNVLSDEDNQPSTTHKRMSLDISTPDTLPSDKVSLYPKDGHVEMNITNKSGNHNLSVSQDDTLLEIEERPATKKITIAYQNGLFVLSQNDFRALTQYPLTVDAKSAKLSVETETGQQFVGVLPVEAIDSAFRSGLIDRVADNNIVLIEDENQLTYKVTGTKIIDILSLYNYEIPVEAYVSASNGTILKINSETWYRFLNILFQI